MARALIVGCGCRGRALGQRLIAEGWVVRGTARESSGVDRVSDAGIEGALADPNQPGTILNQVGDVTVVVYLLGSATGDPGGVSTIHGPRLQSLLEKLVDTPVRGFVYEARGSVDPAVLAAGREIVAAAAERWRIPVAFLEGVTSDGAAEEVLRAVLGLVGQELNGGGALDAARLDPGAPS
jgi:hypothetical protein